MTSLAAYLSHSWKPSELPVNLMLWAQIAKACHLIIDQPEPSSEQDCHSQNEIPLLPFLTHGRTRPAVDLRRDEFAHQVLSDSQSPEFRAEEVAERVVLALQQVRATAHN